MNIYCMFKGIDVLAAGGNGITLSSARGGESIELTLER